MKVNQIISNRAHENNIVPDKTNLLNILNCDNLFYDYTNQTEFDNNFDWIKSIRGLEDRIKNL